MFGAFGPDEFGVMARPRPLIPEGGFLPSLMLTAEISPEVKRPALAGEATDFLQTGISVPPHPGLPARP